MSDHYGSGDGGAYRRGLASMSDAERARLAEQVEDRLRNGDGDLSSLYEDVAEKGGR